jgi:hypothetical protein
MKLTLDDNALVANDKFHLYFDIFNPDATAFDSDAYLLLDVYGNFWCWPSWQTLDTGIDKKTISVDAESSYHEEVLEFDWPSGVGSADQLFFYGAIFAPGTFDLIGDFQTVQFSYN